MKITYQEHKVGCKLSYNFKIMSYRQFIDINFSSPELCPSLQFKAKVFGWDMFISIVPKV